MFYNKILFFIQRRTILQAQDNDRFLITSGGNKIVVWNFFCKKSDLFVPKSRGRKEDKHQEPVTCVAVSRDGSLAVSGSLFDFYSFIHGF